VLGALRAQGVETDVIRLADHRIDFGVVSEAVSEGDEWPAIRERILASEILVMAIPTWLGQPSSVSKVALERMDAFLSETREDGRTPVAYNRVAGVVCVGNEDGAHHVIGETNIALNDIGYSMPARTGPTGTRSRPGRGGVADHRRARLVDLDRQGVRVEPPRARPRAAGLADPAAARVGDGSASVEVERDAVHAEALPTGMGWPVVEDVTEVRVAPPAEHLCACHAELAVGAQLDGVGVTVCVKLGHPVRESNLALLSNSGLPHARQR
jgi:hypothetical protein